MNGSELITSYGLAMQPPFDLQMAECYAIAAVLGCFATFERALDRDRAKRSHIQCSICDSLGLPIQ